jgi:hypothetical protein
MPFSNAENNNFFDNGPQMNLLVAVRLRLQNEGLSTVDDFIDFHDDELNQAFKNLRTPIPGIAGIPGIPAQVNNAGVEVIAEVPPIAPTPGSPAKIVSAQCIKRLKVASVAYHYYDSIARAHTAPNMNYTTVLRDFYLEWEAVLALNKEDKADVPLLSKQVPPLKWIESFKNHLFNTFGIRKCPLLYVIRDTAEVPTEVDDPLLPGKAFGVSGSVVDKLIKRMSHTNPLFKHDNAMVFALLDQATRGTIYSTTIKPYARKKDGRSAYLTLIASHAGKDKWEQTQKERLNFLMTTKWNGKSYSLEVFTGYHRSAFIQLQEASAHVDFQLPTEQSRVGFLLDNIMNPDPDLCAVIAQIRIEQNGMRDNFDLAVESLLPVDPYAKHHRKSAKKGPQINALKGQQDSKTGVDLCWHTKDEYKSLTKAQRIELSNWQKSKAGKEAVNKQKVASGFKGKPSTKSKLRAKIKALEAQVGNTPSPSKSPEDQPPASISATQLQQFIASVSSATQSPQATSPPKSSTPTLQGILKRKRNYE